MSVNLYARRVILFQKRNKILDYRPVLLADGLFFWTVVHSVELGCGPFASFGAFFLSCPVMDHGSCLYKDREKLLKSPQDPGWGQGLLFWETLSEVFGISPVF